MTYTINTTECTFCGLCAAECPQNIITIEKSSKTASIATDGRCIECSHCGMVCPVNAVRVDGMPLQAYAEDRTAIDHLINSKRSVRDYKREALKTEDLDAIILAGQLTATASNTRQVGAIVLQGEEVTSASKVIAGIFIKFINIARNPIVGAFLNLTGLRRYAGKDLLEDFHKRVTDTLEGHGDAFFFKAPAVVILTYPGKGKSFGRTDCALAGENMMLSAHARGIGSCMIGFAEVALFTKRLRKKAGVPADRKIGLVFTLGYQKPKYFRYPKRPEFVI